MTSSVLLVEALCTAVMMYGMMMQCRVLVYPVFIIKLPLVFMMVCCLLFAEVFYESVHRRSLLLPVLLGLVLFSV